MEEEMPPEWMWPLDHELEVWFDEIERKRAEKYGLNKEDEQTPMMDNEFAERFRRK